MSDFWSRRKAAVQAEERAQEVAAVQAEARARDDELAERPDAELLSEAGMPEPEALIDSAQVKAFMKSALPERLKKRALRRLWRLNPVLANLDGLNDYDDDYTDAAVVVKDMRTSYKVGRGMLDVIAKHAEAVAQRAEDAQDEAEVPHQDQDGMALAAMIDQAEPVPEAAPAADTSATDTPFAETSHAAAEQTMPTGRRMAFSFGAGTT